MTLLPLRGFSIGLVFGAAVDLWLGTGSYSLRFLALALAIRWVAEDVELMWSNRSKEATNQ